MEMPSYPGIEFSPRDDHQLTFYLPRKIAEGRDALAIPNFLMHDFDVYSTEPWNLPRDTFRYQNNKDMHFFSRRQPIGTNSKRVQRTAGQGFWYEKVYCESQHVGYKTILTFKYTKGGKEINNNWIMHEFHLKPAENSNKFESMVICRIHKKKTKEDREGRPDVDSCVAAIIEQEEQGTTTHVDEKRQHM
ncbi:protein ATAF2-like [Asparagus officinalis]|uniref:protein ATAF2-like n=1 Tax=Asparagus officinalis TaxID=4686 RepID=UPI00098DE212|nr:protein ATAF2-like [Asparagus officinalis]